MMTYDLKRMYINMLSPKGQPESARYRLSFMIKQVTQIAPSVKHIYTVMLSRRDWVNDEWYWGDEEWGDDDKVLHCELLVNRLK